MECHTIQAYFSAYLDGELPRAKAELVSRHLEACGACRREYQAWQQLWEALAAEPVAAPPHLAGRVLAHLPKPAQPWWRSLALAASLLLGVFLGGRLGLEMHYQLLAGPADSTQLAWEGFEATPGQSLDALLANHELDNGGGS